MGFDQLNVLYRRYTVVGAKITVRFSPSVELVSPNTLLYYCGITPSNGTPVGITSIHEVCEQPGTAHAVVTNTTAPLTLTHTFSARRDFGVTDPLDDDTIGASDSDPARQWLWNIWVSAPASASGFTTVRVSYTIVYHVVFTQPRIIPSS